MSDLVAVETEYQISYPFVWEEWDDLQTGALIRRCSWRPGHRDVLIGDGDCVHECDGFGHATFHVVSIHKPPKYPARVFFERQYCDPDGKQFGKKKLHIVTLTKFKRLVLGYALSCALKPKDGALS